MMNKEKIAQVLEQADCIFDEQQVTVALDRMAKQLHELLVDDESPIYMCVMNGGFFTSTRLLEKSQQLAVQLDYLHATRYQGGILGGQLLWKSTPNIDLQQRTVVLIDDIYDEGVTIQKIVKSLQGQHPKRIVTCVLTQKKHDRAKGAIKPDIVGLEVPDRYVFGCGMDYQHYFRHLSAIYAVKGL